MEKYYDGINFKSMLLRNKYKFYCIKFLQYYIEKYLKIFFIILNFMSMIEK